ncbi:MAG: aminoacyl-histidine dipeptidase [Mangrovibacterium sp.]
MSNEIQNLSPKAIWENFYSLTQIPRPSHHEEKIQEYLVNFGKNLNLETFKDEAGNIIIRKPATKGLENRIGVILQAHLDMVPQKNSSKTHDFENDAIETIIDGEWVTANETTLGADNGIGVAAAMGVLAATNIEHGPIEVLFTATEETGMDGANGLKPGILSGDILLNLDSEDEGELYVGCAGGEDASVTFKYDKREVPSEFIGGKLCVTGLKGGHSGMDIILQRANANKIFFRVLNELHNELGARLASIQGGSLRNAIPREAFGLVALKKTKWKAALEMVERLNTTIQKEFTATEPSLSIELLPETKINYLINKTTQQNLTSAILACPNGVIRMSDKMPNLVETSVNMATVNSEGKGNKIIISFLMRSSVDSAKAFLGQRIASVFELAGAHTKFSGAYPGWQPNLSSPILKTMQDVYLQMHGKTPEIKAVHAGLECGILGSKYPNWDMISFGPTIRFPHSPDEKVNIESVSKFWEYLLEVLKNIPQK